MIVNPVIGGIEIPDYAALMLKQSYDKLGARHPRRLADGTANLRVAWSGKLKYTISASGWIPYGLTNLDYDNALTVKCAEPLSATEADETVIVPTARRTDVALKGYAIVNGEPVETGIVSTVGDLVTLTTVAGATAYRVDYYPEFSAIVEPPTESLDGNASEYSWELVAEQV